MFSQPLKILQHWYPSQHINDVPVRLQTVSNTASFQNTLAACDRACFLPGFSIVFNIALDAQRTRIPRCGVSACPGECELI